MENENHFDKLLIRYISGDTNLEEASVVSQWINASTENRQYFEQLQSVWWLTVVPRETGKINLDYEWDRFVEAREHSGWQSVSSPVPDRIEPEQQAQPRKSNVRRLLIAASVAATITIITGIGYLLFDNKGVKPGQAVVDTPAETRDTSRYIVRNERNTSGKPRQIELQDGSLVVLSDNSEIRFQEPFQNQRRDITLSGMAEFTVAKDTARPFTVFSGDISTTALGTNFSVAGFSGEKKIRVRLFEGKVVVSGIRGLPRALKQEYYLLPGQELVYDQERVTASVKSFKSTDKNREDDMNVYEPGLDNPSIPENDKGSWYMFNNQSLSQVFDQLQEMYNVKIEYSKDEISNKYFIGKFYKSDSIERILRQIAIVNNLKISRESGKFVVSK